MKGDADILAVWRDFEFRSAGRQMAIDQGLLNEAKTPAIRFYRWDEPGITIGYFQSESEVRAANPGIDVARRRTGGGIVEHGDDITFALAIPRVVAEQEGSRFAPLLRAPVAERYLWIHDKLALALRSCGIEAVVAEPESSALEDGTPARCFAAPVLSDVIDPRDGRKIAGGAQRRSRLGWLHQGSVRLDPPNNRIDAPWTRAFCENVAGGADHVKEGTPAAENGTG